MSSFKLFLTMNRDSIIDDPYYQKCPPVNESELYGTTKIDEKQQNLYYCDYCESFVLQDHTFVSKKIIFQIAPFQSIFDEKVDERTFTIEI